MYDSNRKIPQHKYAINASMLGDISALPWTNLGLWHTPHLSYPQACENLADNLASALNLTSKDAILDLGCGWGASLKRWRAEYKVIQISAVELQPYCIEYLKAQKYLHDIKLYQGSFLNLKVLHLNSKFDVIVCIDALYHHPLPQFLTSISSLTYKNTRLGFHHLVFTERWQQLSLIQRKKYQYLLALADIHVGDLYNQVQLRQVLNESGWHNIDIQILSEPVFDGFARYISHKQKESNTLKGIDGLKIKLTAKLCHELMSARILDYVQVISYKSF